MSGRPPGTQPSSGGSHVSNYAVILNAAAESNTTLSARSRAQWTTILNDNPEVCDEVDDATRAYLSAQGVTVCG